MPNGKTDAVCLEQQKAETEIGEGKESSGEDVMLEVGAERSVGLDDALSLSRRGGFIDDEEEKQHSQSRRCQGHQEQDFER